MTDAAKSTTEWKCGTEAILEECIGVTIPMTDEGFKTLTSEMVASALQFIKVAMMTQAMTGLLTFY